MRAAMGFQIRDFEVQTLRVRQLRVQERWMRLPEQSECRSLTFLPLRAVHGKIRHFCDLGGWLFEIPLDDQLKGA